MSIGHTDTVESVTREIITAARDVGGPAFTEHGYIDVANRLNGVQSLGSLLEAFDFAEQVCVCPPVVLAAFHDLRTACKRVLDVSKAGGTDTKTLAFARLQAVHAASLFQDARNGRISFDEPPKGNA